MRKAITYFLILSALFGCRNHNNETFKTTEIKSSSVEGMLFLKTMNWGLTGDSQITIISTTDKIDFNKKESDDYYIFEGLEPFLYKQSNDSLILYTQKVVNVPKNLKTNWKIIQVTVDNPTLLDLKKEVTVKAP